MTLIARAKRLAGPAASCVQAGIRIDHLTAGLSRGELLALVHVLAAGADPARLRAVTEMPGDTLAAADREALLRQARREAHRLRKADVDVPFGIRVLEAEYFREAKRRQRRPPERRGHYAA